MTLREWMESENKSVEWLAEAVDASVHTVKKWLKFDQKDGRTPRPKMQAKIRDVTSFKVMPNDWVK